MIFLVCFICWLGFTSASIEMIECPQELIPQVCSWILSDTSLSQEQAKVRLSTALLFQQQEHQHYSHGPSPFPISFPSRFLPRQESFQNQSCKQAWDGSGTGAWYRIDTSCNNSNWSQTAISYCLPESVFSAQATDGFYVSLGIYSTITGAGADIGLTLMNGSETLWMVYEFDANGWQSGSTIIDRTITPCIDVLVFPNNNNSASLIVADANNGSVLGLDTFNNMDSAIQLNSNGTNIGFYRFDSIAQAPENLTDGSYMKGVNSSNWILFSNTPNLPTLVFPSYVGDAYGYPPGKCCSPAEVATISTTNELNWYQAIVSISYT